MLQQSIGPILIAAYPFAVAWILGIFLFEFVRIHKKSKQRMFMHLALLYAVVLANQGLMMLAVTSSTELISAMFFIPSQVVEIISFVLLLVVLETFEGERVLSPRVVFFITLGAVIASAMLLVPVLQFDHVATPIGTFIVPSFAPGTVAKWFLMGFSVIAFVWILHTFIKKRKTLKNPKQKHLLFWLFVGIVLAQIVGSLTPVALETGTDLVHQGNVIRDVGMNISLAKILGMLIVGLAFWRVSKEPWLLQMQKVDLLLVYSHNGIVLYSKIFKENISESDIQLLAGAISAVGSLFKESTKMSEPIEAIKFKGKDVRIVNRESFTCALMVDWATQASDSALKIFISEFETRFAANIAGFRGDVTPFEKAGEFAKIYFS